MRRGIESAVRNFSYVFLAGTNKSSLVDWQLLVEGRGERENICCHQLQGGEQLSQLLETFKENFSKVVVLINTSDDYNLSSDLTCNLEEFHLPVVLVRKTDGDEILQCLKQGEKAGKDVHAMIELDIAEWKVGVTDKLPGGNETQQCRSPTTASKWSQCKTIDVAGSVSGTTSPSCM